MIKMIVSPIITNHGKIQINFGLFLLFSISSRAHELNVERTRSGGRVRNFFKHASMLFLSRLIAAQPRINNGSYSRTITFTSLMVRVL